jgi:predicted metalloprotease with PDZ domain
MRKVALVCLLLTSVATAASAQLVPPQNSRPSATAKVDTIPAPRDLPYPGTMQLTVDASDVSRGIFRIHQTVAVGGAGDLVMLYPKWIPGGHSPRGDIRSVTGFRASANGRELTWVRDDLDVSAIHIAVPAGVGAVDIDFQYVSPTESNQGRTVATPDMASIQWISNSMYPAGYYVRQIPVQASVIVPAGWKVGTALRPSAQSGNRIDYPVTSYEILIDSPLIAGAHYRRIELTPDVAIDVLAEREMLPHGRCSDMDGTAGGEDPQVDVVGLDGHQQ